MAEFKGTKGQWWVGSHNEILCGYFTKIAKVHPTNINDPEEHKYNAKVISVAPEMLEVLEETLKLRKEIEYSGEKRDSLSIEVLALGGLMNKIERIVKDAKQI